MIPPSQGSAALLALRATAAARPLAGTGRRSVNWKAGGSPEARASWRALGPFDTEKPWPTWRFSSSPPVPHRRVVGRAYAYRRVDRRGRLA